MKMRHKTWLFAATSALALATAGAANAQTLPPERYNVDARGVDVVRKAWTPVSAQLSIGGETGLSYGRVLLGAEWWDTALNGMIKDTTQIRVTTEGITEVFDQTPSGWAPRENNGSTLTQVGTSQVYTYKRAGTTYRIEALSGILIQPGALTHYVTQREEPNGLRTEYTYSIETYTTPDATFPLSFDIARLQSYQNNTGYQIHYDYVANSLTPKTYSEWQTVQKVTAINLGVDYCDKAAYTCSGLTRTWPSVAFSREDAASYDEETITDQSGVETRYRRSTLPSGGDLMEMFVGSNPTPRTSVEYRPTTNDLWKVTGTDGVWQYTFSDTAPNRETIIQGPLGEETRVISNLSTGLVTSASQRISSSPTSRSWSWEYGGDYRVDVATGPEGETTEYIHDARGNTIQVTQSPKTGGTEADIVTSAIYPSTCANPVTCNLPTSTTDAGGNVTDYTWDSTHGGLLTVTLPAPSSGAARPQTRYAYGAQTAQYKNSSGVIVDAPTSVTMPIEVSACATGASCDGTATEVLTTISYGSKGVANNLLPTEITQGSGTATAMTGNRFTYTPDGDLSAINGPLFPEIDDTKYFYDTARRVIGVVGPDEDGAGPGLHRAQRYTYNDRGQVTLTEAGATEGYTGFDFVNMTPLLKASTTYDDLGRPVETRQLSAADAVSGVQQVTYDAAGRVSCVATRMNPATFGALPSSACTAATTGGFGPDRIVQTTYDIADRPISTTSAYGTTDAVTQSVTYGAHGQIASLTDGQGNVSVMEYDGFNRASRLRYPNATGGGTSTTDYEQINYDAQGRVSGARNRAGDTTYFGYDLLNRTIAVNAPGSTPDISSGYDNLGRMTITGNGTITVVTGWDALSRPVSETSSAIGAMEYQYDAAGRLTRIEWPDDFAANYSYDLYGGVTAISQQPAGGSATQVAAYGWNDLGQPTSVSRASGAGASTTRGYDAWGRMTSLAHDASGSTNDVTLGFSYSPADQIVGRTVSNAAYLHGASATGATAYAVDGQNQLDTINGVAVSHDNRGNVTSVSGSTYGYDDLNRLTSASAGAGATTFAFDPMNRLATSTVGGVSTRRQYVGEQLVAEYNPATGAMTKRYIPGLGLDDVAVAYDGSGTSTRTWQLADERGSVIALSGSTGAVSTINTYDEYGVPASGNAGRFQYTGQQWLPEAGAYHYRARAYLPQVGRFLQTDPIGYAAGANLYGYVGADPVNLIDPLGLCPPNDLECDEATEIDEVVVTGRRPQRLPFHIAVQIAITTSPLDIIDIIRGDSPSHNYDPVVKIANQCNLSNAERRYLAQHFSTPFAPQTAAVNGRVSLFGGNSIDQRISTDGFTVVNQTVVGHVLHSNQGGGSITRTFNVGSDGALYSYTNGNGTNYNRILSLANVVGGEGIFRALDIAAANYVRSSGICD